MAGIPKFYDVFDVDIKDYLVERATLQEISEEIGVEIPYMRQCMSRKYRIKNRYYVLPSEPIPESLLIMWDTMVAGLHKEVISK